MHWLSHMKPGRILGHEGVGVVEEVGPDVRNFKKGDRVVIGSTIGCGYCSYCRVGLYSQCDNANRLIMACKCSPCSSKQLSESGKKVA